jgi:hypothetical protein
VPIAIRPVRRYVASVAGLSVPELLSQYRSTLIEMHENRVEVGGKPRSWNRLVNKMQSLHLSLRETTDGRAGITDLALNGDNETVRGWSAANALAWDATSVRPVLESQAQDGGLGLSRLSAETVLKEFDAGRLKTDWVPKGR